MKREIKLSLIIASIILAVSFSSSGCGIFKGKDPVLVSIGKTKITLGDFQERIDNLPKRYQLIIKKRSNQYLQELINDTLLYNEALKKNLDEDKDAVKVIEEAKKKILIARLLKDEVDDSIEITDEDISVYYEDNTLKYMSPEIMRVSHILVPKKEEAEAILERLDKGENFDDLARARSMDPTAQNAGDIGYFPKGQLIPEFEYACSQLEIGQISGIVRTKLGYHIIMLTDRKLPQQKPLEEVEEKVKAEIRAVKRQQLFNSLLSRLRGENKIKINDEALVKLNSAEQTGGR